MGVAHVNQAAADAAGRRFDGHPLVRLQPRPAHVDLGAHGSALHRQHQDGVRAVARPQLELGLGLVLEDGVAGGDAEPVAALLRLGAVGVEDPDREFLRVEEQQTVGSQAALPVTKPWDQPPQPLGGGGEVQDQVVVSQRLILDQVEEGGFTVAGGHRTH